MKIILITHGEVGKELIQSCEMILGSVNDVFSLSLKPGKSMEELLSETDELINSLTGSILIVTDLFGGTPNNVAMYCSGKYDVKVMTGLNLAMLVSLILGRDGDSLEKAIDKSICDAKASIQRCQLVREEKNE